MENGTVATTATLKFRHHKGDVGTTIPVPDLRRARVTDLRGKEKAYAEEWREARYGNASWWASSRALFKGLEARNSLDAELFRFASERVRAQLLQRDPSLPPLPPLPCTGHGGICWDGLRGEIPENTGILGSV